LRLLDGVRRALATTGVGTDSVEEAWVAGAFEIPVVAKAYAGCGRFDAVVAIGCVIRGETTHFEHVAGECAHGLQLVSLETGRPVGFGVLTTEDLDQALARSEGVGGHNVGEDAVHAVVEVARLLRAIEDVPTRP
jgi:6,7-dimethyl-8-ribityllumazine synthase